MKTLSLLFVFVALFGLFRVASAGDYAPGQLIVDIKHEYLPITPIPNGEGIIETGLPSIDSLNVLYGVYDFLCCVRTSVLIPFKASGVSF